MSPVDYDLYPNPKDIDGWCVGIHEGEFSGFMIGNLTLGFDDKKKRPTFNFKIIDGFESVDEKNTSLQNVVADICMDIWDKHSDSFSTERTKEENDREKN